LTSLRSKTQRRPEKDVVALNPKEACRIVDHNFEPGVDIAAVDSQPGGQKVAKSIAGRYLPQSPQLRTPVGAEAKIVNEFNGGLTLLQLGLKDRASKDPPIQQKMLE